MGESPRWWSIRAAQNVKPVTYVCPFCDELLPSMIEHMLVLPEGDVRRRRHAHTACVMTEKRAGRLPSRDQWLESRPRPPGRFTRLWSRTRTGA